MPLPSLTPPPTAPARNQSDSVFNANVDAFIAWFTTARAEYLAFGAAVVAQSTLANYSATSVTSVAVGTGSKAFTIEAGKALQVGEFILVASTASPTNYMAGQVLTYDTVTGALVVTVTTTGGAGTFAAWTISLTPNFGGGVVGTTGTFSGAVSMTALTATSGTFSGTLQSSTFTSGTSSALGQVNVNGPTGSILGYWGRIAGAARWGLFLGDGTTESGSNAGSAFVLNRYSDAGSNIGTALTISRATGAATFGAALAAVGAISSSAGISGTTGTFTGPVKVGVYTVATLPSAASAGVGAKAFVTDLSTTASWNATLTGGGGAYISATSDGTVWRQG